MMNKKDKFIIYFAFMQMYLLFAAYNFSRGSQWLYDNLFSMAILTLTFFMVKWLKIQKLGFVLINIALLTNNLGMFNFYEWKFRLIEYDMVIHFFNSLVASYLIFNFIARKLHIKEKQRIKHTIIDEHKFMLIFLVLGSVTLLGTMIEILEFLGFLYFGPGEGIFFVGVGDSGKAGDIIGQYTDTMTDIIVNSIGSLTGVLIYYQFKYKKQPWLRY